jgi:hypothetical protein
LKKVEATTGIIAAFVPLRRLVQHVLWPIAMPVIFPMLDCHQGCAHVLTGTAGLFGFA